MHYIPFSLNGAWEMDYSEQVYTGKENPWREGVLISNAVPGYWEDMAQAFENAPFYSGLKINPDFTTQSYPMTGEAPDMALPNIVGNFFYRRTFRHTKNSARDKFTSKECRMQHQFGSMVYIWEDTKVTVHPLPLIFQRISFGMEKTKWC